MYTEPNKLHDPTPTKGTGPIDATPTNQAPVTPVATAETDHLEPNILDTFDDD